MTEEEILEKLEKSRESAAKGNHKSAEVVVSELSTRLNSEFVSFLKEGD